MLEGLPRQRAPSGRREARVEALEVALGGAARRRAQGEYGTRHPHPHAVREAGGQQSNAEIGDQITEDGVQAVRAKGNGRGDWI